jgi:ERF superfamily
LGLNTKLLEIQKQGVELQKSALNPHFKSKYIPLEEVIGKVVPLLNDSGIILLQSVGHYEGTPVLVTSLTDVETDERLETAAPLILDKQTPQAVGSAITYMRRYAILSLLGLVADEDDDANAATTQRRTRTVRREEPTDADAPTDSDDGSLF